MEGVCAVGRAGGARKAPTTAPPSQAFAGGDDGLLAHEEHLRFRAAALARTLTSIESVEGSLEAFARSYRTHGLKYDASARTLHAREWIPGAAAAWLVGEFNDWREDVPLTRDEYGVWTGAAAGVAPGSRVRVRVRHPGGWTQDAVSAWAQRAVPADPGAMGCRYDGQVWAPGAAFEWRHAAPPAPAALHIYEAHVGMSSEAPAVASYAHFTAHVLPRIAAGGYNAVQLMAVAEHSYYGSFGYQVTSPFAVASRSGTPDDFKALVDAAHGLGLRVLLDVVHSHTSSSPTDGLAALDLPSPAGGSYLAGDHPAWGSRLYDYANWETLRLLLSNVAFWLDEFRVDGFRFDGVTSMLYRHHGLGVGFSGDYAQYFSPASNVDAGVYLGLANLLIKRLRPDAASIAEDVSGLPGLCRAVADGGLGFDARLGMGLPDVWGRALGGPDPWPPAALVAGLCNRRRDEATVAYVESHDQCLVGDTTLAWRLMGAEMYAGMGTASPPSPTITRGVALHKLARAMTLALGGDAWLNFMGNEFGHPEWVDFPRDGNGWSHDKARRLWSLADAPDTRYAQLGAWDRALMALDERHGMLASDHLLVSHEGGGVGASPGAAAAVAERGPVVWVFNLSPCETLTEFKIGVPDGGEWAVAADSDAAEYGGSGSTPTATLTATPEGVPGQPETNFNNRAFSARITVPPRAAVAFVRARDL